MKTARRCSGSASARASPRSGWEARTGGGVLGVDGGPVAAGTVELGEDGVDSVLDSGELALDPAFDLAERSRVKGFIKGGIGAGAWVPGAVTRVPCRRYIGRVLNVQRMSGPSGLSVSLVLVAAVVSATLFLVAPENALGGVGSISGAMTHGGVEPGGPVVEGWVCALKSEGEERVQGQNCAENRLPDGDYTIPNLPSGGYKVQFWPAAGGVNWVWEYYGDTRVWSQSPWVEVINGPVTGIDAELPEGGYISGSVRRASDGNGLARARVCAEEPLTGFSECKQVGEPGGSYQLFGLIEGDYVVEFLPTEGQGVRAQFYDGKSKSSEAELVHVTTGVQTEPIDATLPAQATIAGHVTDVSTGAGLPEIEVCAFELSGPEITECEFSGLGGSYELTDLPTGVYKVGFFSETVEEEEEALELSPFPAQFWDVKSSWEAAEILTLGLGVTRGIDAALGTPPPAPPNQSPGASPASIAPSLASSALPTTGPPRARCRSGRRWKKVNGRTRCVEVHKRAHHKHAHRRQSPHAAH